MINWLTTAFSTVQDIVVHTAQTYPTECYFFGALLVISVISIAIYEN